MTIYFYDQKSGNPVCYSPNAKDYYTMDGAVYAYVKNDYWYSYKDNSWFGWQKDNWLYDSNGNPLYFTEKR
jgi:hypothetical protein